MGLVPTCWDFNWISIIVKIKIMLKFIFIFTAVALTIILLFSVYSFISKIVKHKKRMKNLNQWSEFHKKLSEWALEIKDEDIKIIFISECISKLNQTEKKIINFDEFDWNLEKMKVYEKWGQHIPSLLQEVRQEKLNKLVK